MGRIIVQSVVEQLLLVLLSAAPCSRGSDCTASELRLLLRISVVAVAPIVLAHLEPLLLGELVLRHVLLRQVHQLHAQPQVDLSGASSEHEL